MQEHEDSIIIDRVKQGDTDCFEHLVNRYQKRLHVYIVNLIRDREKAEDILQEVFLSAFLHISSFNRERGSFSTWIHTIARNRCRNETKKILTLNPAIDPFIELEKQPDDHLLKKEIFEKLNTALDQLPFNDRSLFSLYEFEGLSYKEIAWIEAIDIGTVKSRLSRIRQKLKTLLREYAL
ncbi:MAG: sigma-70 family RNA polymerase sigma factor [Pseudomonadota bacterium]